ncbi:MAG: methyltransferase domain-containing protein [Chloroflexota bacterium]
MNKIEELDDKNLPLIDLDRICDIVAKTYDNITDIYALNHFGDQILAEPQEIFVQNLRRLAKRRVLCIGTGPGSEISFFKSRGFQVCGIDASEKMIQMASSRVQGAEFRQMRMQNLEFLDDEFDAIWSARTLIHIPKEFVVDMLVSWKRVLKPGGLIGLGIIMGNRDGWAAEEYNPEFKMFNHYFAENEINDALCKAGFDILDVHNIVDDRDPINPNNLFIIAKKTSSILDLDEYSRYVTMDGENKKLKVAPENLENVISILLRLGNISALQKVNLCILYDQLATYYRPKDYLHKIIAQKLKIHLATPETLKSENFIIWFTLGRLHLKLTQFEKAVDCFKKAITIDQNSFQSLVRLGYSYEGLAKFDEAILAARDAERIADNSALPEVEIADLYHALGHFYVGRSHIGHEDDPVQSDVQIGEQYMEKACATGQDGYGYLSCLGGIYTETKRYSDAIRTFERAMGDEKVRKSVALYNELHFYRGEAYMMMGSNPYIDYYSKALADFEHVEQYAKVTENWDALAHVILYKVRAELKRQDVGKLTQAEIERFLVDLYEHEPSLFVVESFRRDRLRLISILRAFSMLKYCLDENISIASYNSGLYEAITNLESLFDGQFSYPLTMPVLVDSPILPESEYIVNTKFKNLEPRYISFDEIGTTDLPESLRPFSVWGVIIRSENPLSTQVLSKITYYVGRFHEKGYTIFIYDPHNHFPSEIRSANPDLFIDDVESLFRTCYTILLYERAKEYIGSPKTPLGMAPIGVAPSMLAAQSDEVDLLSLS